MKKQTITLNKKLLQKKKVEVQNLVNSLDYGISFYNVFNKENRALRKDPDRYLVCFARSIEIRNDAFRFIAEKGYSCIKGKTYDNDEQERSWTFKIDLLSKE